jgi:PAS domain S-box-containing protein
MNDQSMIAATNIFKAIFDNAPIGIYTITNAGIIDSFNPKMVEMAGAKDADEVIGLDAFEMETYKKAGLDTYFRSGLDGKPFETEVKYISLTGNKETWRHYRGVPLWTDDHTRIEHLLLLVSDISNRKALEFELRHNAETLELDVAKRTKELQGLEEQYRTVIEESLVGMYVMQNDTFVYVNPTFVRLFGYDTAPEITNRPWQDIVHPDDVALILNSGLADRMQGKGQKAKYSFRGKRKDGSIFTVEVMSNPSTFEGMPAIIGSLQDISLQKEMEKKNKEHIAGLEQFEKIAINRELKMIELKNRIAELEKQLAVQGHQ